LAQPIRAERRCSAEVFNLRDTVELECGIFDLERAFAGYLEKSLEAFDSIDAVDDRIDARRQQ